MFSKEHPVQILRGLNSDLRELKAALKTSKRCSQNCGMRKTQDLATAESFHNRRTRSGRGVGGSAGWGWGWRRARGEGVAFHGTQCTNPPSAPRSELAPRVSISRNPKKNSAIKFLVFPLDCAPNWSFLPPTPTLPAPLARIVSSFGASRSPSRGAAFRGGNTNRGKTA